MCHFPVQPPRILSRHGVSKLPQHLYERGIMQPIHRWLRDTHLCAHTTNISLHKDAGPGEGEGKRFQA